MPVNIRGTADPIQEAIAAALRPYATAHPAAEVDVYRYSPVSVRVRVLDPDFRGKSRSERHRTVWPLLYALDEDTLGELTMLLLLAPDERDSSAANRDFEVERHATGLAAAYRAIQENGSAAP